MRLLLPMLWLVALSGCLSFDEARRGCVDAGRCVELVDGGTDGQVDADAGFDAGQGAVSPRDAGCASPAFDGLAEVCPTAPVSPMHGSAYLHAGSPETARAWCVEKGYLGAYSYQESGARNCNSCFYVTGSVGYGLVVQWGPASDGCDSCGAITQISCY
jgi:hypothetical protein